MILKKKLETVSAFGFLAAWDRKSREKLFSEAQEEVIDSLVLPYPINVLKCKNLSNYNAGFQG